MKAYLELVGLAKSKIDNGFSQVGKKLAADDPVHRALMLLAGRCVSIANGLMILALNNHANESLPMLRSLLQLAVEMRWIAEKDSAPRALAFLSRAKDSEWTAFWDEKQLVERMRALGFQKALEERALLSCYDHVHANAQGLPWGHVFSENAHKGLTGEDSLRSASAIMGHVVKALDQRWPGAFPDAEHFWRKTEMLG